LARTKRKLLHQCPDLEVGLKDDVCRGKGDAYGLKRCIDEGNTALGNLRSEVLTEVGLGDPEELGVEEGGGVICGL
jgi:hypothetical protein